MPSMTCATKASFRMTAFAGHSLSKYSALTSIADVLPVSSLVDVVFYQGITMQLAVKHDSENWLNHMHMMCAINPGRIPKTFTESGCCSSRGC